MSVLPMTIAEKNKLDAGFSAVFGVMPERYFYAAGVGTN